MQHVQNNAFVVHSTLCMLFVMANSESMPQNIYIESKKTMNHGILKAKDKFGAPIQLAWEQVDVTTLRLNDILKEVSPILAHTYAGMELQFARKHPEAIETEMFLKSLASYFKDGIEHVDWLQVEKVLYANLVQFFSETDFAKYLARGECQWFVIAKDAQTGEMLGLIQFLIQPQFPAGTVKVAMFGIEEDAHERGIDRLLIASIFRLLSGVSRIFLHTRVTNTAMLGILKTWGFMPCEGPLPYWADREYLADVSGYLQKIAEGIAE